MTKTLIIKKAAVFVFAAALVCAVFLVFVGRGNSESITYAADEENTIVLTIDSPIMSVNGEEKEIDPEGGTAPVIISGRTLVPIRAIIENMGGTVEWKGEARESILTYGEDVIRLTIDSQTAYLNDSAWIGAGATILPGVSIGKYAIVGAASVVTRDVPDYAVVVGNPAKLIKTLNADRFTEE